VTEQSKSDRLTLGVFVAGVLAIGCCAGIPLAAGAVVAIGGFAFGAIAFAVLLVLVGGLALLRRRRHACPSLTPSEPRS